MSKLEDALTDLVDASDDPMARSKHSQFFEKIASAGYTPRTDIENPEVEYVLRQLRLANTTTGRQRREHALVCEDNIGNAFQGQTFSLAQLHQSIRDTLAHQYGDERADEDFPRFVASSKEPKRLAYFKDRRMSEEQAQALTLSLSFYTGLQGGTDGSQQSSRGANAAIRCGNMLDLEDGQKDIIVRILPILYHTVNALSNIPYYFGECSRFVDLDTEELQNYQPGTVFAWMQFSSSKKGTGGAADFKERNTKFHIYSVTGRPIQQFSNYPEEDEVLFLPFSTFLVTAVKSKGNQNHIYVRQIECGQSKQTVVWCDHHIFEEDWENKALMEYACGQNLDVRFVCKPTTDLAMSWLNSPFAEMCVAKTDGLRIITNMNRTNEKHPAPGADFIKQAGSIFKKAACPIMCFTSSKQAATDKIKRECGSVAPNVQVTTTSREAANFISFA